MGNFIDKIFGSKIEVDLLKIALQAKLCFHDCRIDSQLTDLVFKQLDTQKQEAFLLYLAEVSAVSEGQVIPVSQEIDLLQRYVNFYREASQESLFLRVDCKLESDRAVPAFILFPLVCNALKNGYNTMEKFPLKIKVRIFEKAVQLEVTNHVNHHITAQEHTPSIALYKSRLISLYGEEFDLLFNSNSHTFKANLYIRA